MSNERDNFSNHERGFDSENLKDIAAERQKELANEQERNANETKRDTVEKARRDVLEHASQKEAESKKVEKSLDTPPPVKRGPASKAEREASFNATMQEVRSQMSAPSRTFSKVIHTPVVEKVSDVVGGTVARPNAILFGAVFAFLLTLGIYLVARFNGYPLSGAETIASFAVGWVLGLVFDYFRLLLLGKK